MTLKKQFQNIWIDLRMIVVYQLASWIVTVAPNTPEGAAFAERIVLTVQERTAIQAARTAIDAATQAVTNNK